MRKMSKIKSAFILGSYVLFAAVIIKIMLTLYYGYVNVDPTYGYKFYQFWRIKYVDRNISKSRYGINPEGDRPGNKTYVDYITIASNKTSKNPLITKYKLYPAYMYQQADAFPITSRNTWMIFLNNEPLKLMELDFLGLRSLYLKHLNHVPDAVLNSEGSSLENVNDGIVDKSGELIPSYYTIPETKVDIIKILDGIVSNTNDTGGEREILDLERISKSRLVHNFQKIIDVLENDLKLNMMEDKDRRDNLEYYIEVDKDKKSVTMSELLSKSLKQLITSYNSVYNVLGDIKEDELTEMLNGFWYRIATVKPNNYDMYVLGRMYVLYGMCRNDVELDEIIREIEELSTNVLVDSKKHIEKGIKDLRNTIDTIKKLENEISNTKDEDKLDELRRKLKLNVESQYEKRTELIYNKFTAIIVNILVGKKDVDSLGDKRNLVEKLGNPGTF